MFPYLTLQGIPSQNSPDPEGIFFSRDLQGTWLPSRYNCLVDIEKVCVQIHDALAARVFRSTEEYWKFLRASPELLSTAGMNSESAISKDIFTNLLTQLPPDLPINKALYLYDCRKLVASIQECSKEVIQLQGEFYQTLNLEELFSPNIHEDDGLRWVTSPTVTKIFALLGFIYIRLHSLLDYATKLVIEVENLKSDFESYPRLASKNCLYGDRKKVSINGQAGTLFEPSPELTEIETVRNHVIHDGLLDDMPKVYRVISGGKCIEKFVLFPDRSDEGRFEAFKNRNLFYGNEDKINLRLPMVVSSFQIRLIKTLELLLVKLGTHSQ